MARNARSRGFWQGMNWIRQESRLSIYIRDGLTCLWCGDTVTDGITLTLDHVIPHSAGGSNHPSNLVTCCATCNSERGARPAKSFARGKAGTMREIKAATARKRDRKAAKALVDAHGSCAKAVEALMVECQ